VRSEQSHPIVRHRCPTDDTSRHRVRSRKTRPRPSRYRTHRKFNRQTTRSSSVQRHVQSGNRRASRNTNIRLLSYSDRARLVQHCHPADIVDVDRARLNRSIFRNGPRRCGHVFSRTRSNIVNYSSLHLRSSRYNQQQTSCGSRRSTKLDSVKRQLRIPIGFVLHHPAAATPEFIRICAVSAVHRQSVIECETTSSSMWTVHYCAGLRPSTNRGDESAFPTVVRFQVTMCSGLRRTFADLVNNHLRSVSRQGRVLFDSAQSCRRQLLVDTDNARLRRSIFQY